jgi:S1-C subfamily serine protease
MKYLCAARVTCFALLLTAGSSAYPDLPSEATMRKASASVVRVQARECDGGKQRTASGFVWRDNRHVVTALHVVSGCARLSIFSEHSGNTIRASIERTLKSADLVLLKLDRAAQTPLQPAKKNPDLHADLVALGYELGAPTMSSKNLTVSFGKHKLSDMLPDNVRREIEAVGAPSLDLNILRLQGHLVPGLSGAPLINSAGRVVAVGDGGLEYGAVSISWALPIDHIDALLQSSEAAAAATMNTSGLFAAELDAQATDQINCGNMTFTRIRRATYGDLSRTADDPQGLSLFQQIAQLHQIDVRSLAFDIYSNLDTGATISIPADMQVEPDLFSDDCIVTAFDNRFVLVVRGSRPANILLSANQFQTDMGARTDHTWAIDPQFSYVAPIQRFDGLEVNRASYNGMRASDLTLGFAMASASAFETLIARDDAFVGMLLFNYDPRTWDPTVSMACALMPTDPECQQLQAEVRLWLTMLLGSFLSTFSIG